MKTISGFISGLDGQQKRIVTFLDYHLTDHHGLMGKIRFNIPMYYGKSWVCYLNPIKGDGIELAFLNGSELSNDQGILQSKGRKMVAGIDLFDIAEIPERAINEIVQEALILDEMRAQRKKGRVKK